MSRFLDDAESLFQAASGASEPADLAITLSAGGGIRIVDAAGWDLSALQLHSGASTVYRISRNYDGIRVEGRSGSRSCVLTAEFPAATAQRLLNSNDKQPLLWDHTRLLEAPFLPGYGTGGHGCVHPHRTKAGIFPGAGDGLA